MVRALLISTAAFALSMPAFAQEAPAEEESGIQDIVVTAQRRAESAQDVPIAISAFSSEQLESQGVGNTLSLGQYVPNLFAQNNTGLGSANAYFLRGLGNTETIATFDPPVGTYVDDIYISRQNANNLSLFDVERVEVLRGPQGTLFGRNTTGGAINVIMRKPGDEIAGYAEIGYGSYRKKLARGSIDLPLADSFAIKLSGYWQDDRGYAKNITTGERANDDDGWGVRLGMPARVSAWAIYDVFETSDEPVFIGVVTDALWEKFCAIFGLKALWADETLRRNNDRVAARDRIMPEIRDLIAGFTREDIITRLEGTGLPFAPIGKPEDLFDDPHLLQSGGLECVIFEDGRETSLPVLPVEMNGKRANSTSRIAHPSADRDAILIRFGFGNDEIKRLADAGIIG